MWCLSSRSWAVVSIAASLLASSPAWAASAEGESVTRDASVHASACDQAMTNPGGTFGSGRRCRLGVDGDAGSTTVRIPAGLAGTRVVTVHRDVAVATGCRGPDTLCYRIAGAVIVDGEPAARVREADVVHTSALPITVGPVPETGPLGADHDRDRDGFAEHAIVHMRWITIHSDGSISQSPAPGIPVPVDTDDRDPSEPKPIVRGPFASATPNCGGVDRVCYEVGADVIFASRPLASVQRGVLDAGALPATIGPVPSTGPLGADHDRDGDGFAEHAFLGTRTFTIHEDGSISQAPAASIPVAVDPDDSDPSWPKPIVRNAEASVTPACGGIDRVCYVVGADVTVARHDVLGVERGVVDAGALPLTIGPVPSTGPLGADHDRDGDGFPEHALLLTRYFTIHEDGTLTQSPGAPIPIAVDPDDSDPSWPKPAIANPTASATPNCGGLDRACYAAGADVTVRGSRVLSVTRGVADSPVLPADVGPVPSTGPLGADRDADGDGFAEHAFVLMRTFHVGEDGSIAQTPEAPIAIPVDPDDGDASNPIP